MITESKPGRLVGITVGIGASLVGIVELVGSSSVFGGILDGAVLTALGVGTVVWNARGYRTATLRPQPWTPPTARRLMLTGAFFSFGAALMIVALLRDRGVDAFIDVVVLFGCILFAAVGFVGASKTSRRG
jgi:fucose permease